MICCHFCHNSFKEMKKYIEFHFQIRYTLALKNSRSPIHQSSKNQIPEQEQRLDNIDGIDLNAPLTHRIQVNYVNSLLYPFSVSACPSPVGGVLCILIYDLTSKTPYYYFPIRYNQISFQKAPCYW